MLCKRGTKKRKEKKKIPIFHFNFVISSSVPFMFFSLFVPFLLLLFLVVLHRLGQILWVQICFWETLRQFWYSLSKSPVSLPFLVILRTLLLFYLSLHHMFDKRPKKGCLCSCTCFMYLGRLDEECCNFVRLYIKTVAEKFHDQQNSILHVITSMKISTPCLVLPKIGLWSRFQIHV